MEEEDYNARRAYHIKRIITGVIICLVGIFIIVAAIAIIYKIISMTKKSDQHSKTKPFKNDKDDNKLCITRQCLVQAARILRNMDNSISPCDDFYNFTCGNFMKHVEIPSDQTRALDALENKKIVEAKLIQAYRSGSEKLIKPLRDVKRFYYQCVHSETGKNNTYKSLITILKRLRWPVLYKNWDKYADSFDWLEWEGRFALMGLAPAFLKTELKYDMRNFSITYIGLDCTAPTLSKKILETGKRGKYVKKFEYVVRQFLKLIIKNYKGNTSTDITDFFLQLETIKPSSYEISDANFFHAFQNISIGNLKQKVNIDLEKFLLMILPSTFTIKNDTIVGTSSLQYLIKMTSMLNQEDKKKIANYMMWVAVQDLLWIISNETRRLNFELNNAKTGVKAPLPLYKLCLNFIDDHIPELSNALYVKKNFSKSKQKHLEKMVSLLLTELKKVVNAVNWMDKATKKMAKLKVKKLSYVIDHVQEIVNDKYLLSAYGKLEMTSSHIIQNVLNIRRASFNHMMNMYHWSAAKRNKLTLIPLAHVVNAFYHPGMNSIAIPSGIAHGSIYSHNQEVYLNFGAIGIIIGHELSHVFDNIGRLYDATGNYINWWSNQSNSNFEQRSRCFIKQYNNFWLGPNLKINGTLTLGENMADSGGTLLAYRAYLKWKDKYSLRKLPGLENFTLRQMFWITLGNTWCDKLRPEALEMFLKTDVHSVGNFRVQGPLLNSREFFRDFNCTTKAGMNYYQRCTVW